MNQLHDTLVVFNMSLPRLDPHPLYSWSKDQRKDENLDQDYLPIQRLLTASMFPTMESHRTGNVNVSGFMNRIVHQE
ncbi:uncharacterized protein FFMR_08983 [Fusarium fujikuroi]|nr:uncharacterized protein FFC1_05117 [Fusarium fujikuroi]SCO23581.1 uncharacterized protein FFE2_15645 [Fusarium fujikuroi]SCO48074.1 uncharacterized protein FFMR_08983 [Fusarium fujikuroi]SCV61050.1 uncharacterized protein FFFS_15619 [Fusarium fujikuroi]